MSATSRDMGVALPPAAEGLLAKTAAQIDGDADESAFVLVPRAEDALAWRLALIDSATESIDLQYFIWKGDVAGTLLFSRLIEAAERAVRVRLLVDDLNLRADDEELAELDQHTNIAINLWNPSTEGSEMGVLGESATAFEEPNKRMHNKMLLSDGRFAIAGGRNVANEYFGLDEKYNFLDLEVLAAGPIVAEMGRAFDAYWMSKPSVSISQIARVTRLASLANFVAADQRFIDQSDDRLGRFPTRPQDWAERFEHLPERWHLGRALWVQDEPVPTGEDEIRLNEIVDLTAAPVEDELYVVSAYLIPVGDLLANIKHMVADGIGVKIVTGTMESVNHTASYAHYRKDIGAILDTGAELYEVDGQPKASLREAADTPPVHSKFVAIHLKGLAADREKVFIGSLNLDPRALVINTEGGLYIESPGLGAELADWYDEVTSPGNAWRVTKDGVTGKLSWSSGGEVRDSSPDRGPTQRFAADFLESLPIKGQL